MAEVIYLEDLSVEERRRLGQLYRVSIARLKSLNYPFQATFDNEVVTVLGRVRNFEPYASHPLKGNEDTDEQMMVRGSNGRKFIALGHSLFIDGQSLVFYHGYPRRPGVPWLDKLDKLKENPIDSSNILLYGAAAVVGVIILGTFISMYASVPSDSSGTNTHQETYRGYTFQTTYFADWYHGTGWSFMFIDKSPDNNPVHTNAWMGVVDSQEQAAADARYMVDSYL